MSKHLAETLVDLLTNPPKDPVTIAITLNSDYMLEVNSDTANAELEDNIMRVNCKDGIISYFNVLDVILIEMKKIINVNVNLTQVEVKE